jgi:succinoglycan biosynthesis protein ExoO
MGEEAIDVSVIITTFNVERYVRRAIESALSQTGINLEVIVVDDCSTDETWSLVAGFDDSRLKRVRLEENAGPSLARNVGFSLAQGAWLAVLDGDDAFMEGRLKRCIERARALSATVVVDNIYVSREADGKSFLMFPKKKFARNPTLTLARFIDANRLFSGGYSLGYLKPIFSGVFLAEHKIRYDQDLRIGEDYMLLADVLASGAVCAVEPKPGYTYTVRTGSISYRLTLADINRMRAGDRKFLARHKLSGPALKAQRRRTKSLLEARAFTLLVMALKQKDIIGVIKAISESPKAVVHLWRPLWVRLCRLIQCD